jgi:outer membrane biosynthesis protein TonB
VAKINERNKAMASKKSEESFTVSKNRAVLIFQALGFQTADQWDVARLQKRINNLRRLSEGAELDKKTRKRVNGILEAQEKDCSVVVYDPETVEEEEQIEADLAAAKKDRDAAAAEKRAKSKRKAKREQAKKEKEDKKMAKKTKKKVSKKTAKKTAKKSKKTAKKTEAAQLDKFGSRKGSNTAAINAALGKKPQRMGDLVKKAGQSGTFYEHLNKLINAGHAKKVEGKGYALV